ncbi:hypothetical protein QIS74_12369 [Colletotrichum tabaci]|uniref:Uncharacterized protein n=1 Tax=Colletotrichum tabaci TaxID=1209068 RepID=A0AAV9SX71_9PEZI
MKTWIQSSQSRLELPAGDIFEFQRHHLNNFRTTKLGNTGHIWTGAGAIHTFAISVSVCVTDEADVTESWAPQYRDEREPLLSVPPWPWNVVHVARAGLPDTWVLSGGSSVPG